MAQEIFPKKTTINFEQIVNLLVKLGVLFLIFAWCFEIMKPFVNITFGGAVVAVAMYPLFNVLRRRLKNKALPSAIIITVIMVAIILLPGIMLAESLIDGIKHFGASLTQGSFHVIPPPEKIEDWPVVGDFIYNAWNAFSENWISFASNYKDQLIKVGQWILHALIGTGSGFVDFLLSILIGGVFLASSDVLSKFFSQFFSKLAGKDGDAFVQLTTSTIQNVSKGIIGISIVQAILIGIIAYSAGVPYAGIWALLSLILAIIQVGPLPVTVPIMVYFYLTKSIIPAILLSILLFIASLLDNVLKPIILGKGASVPMLVVFIGAIGGFMASGFLGLFLGAIVFTLGYKILIQWVQN